MKRALQLFMVLALIFIAGMALQANSYAATAKKEQKITAEAKKTSIAYGGTTTITVSGAQGKVTYMSSNTSVATVSTKGKVTAKGVGTVKITVKAAATSSYKAATKTITIKVVKAAQKITVSAGTKSLKVKGTTTVSVSGAKGKVTYKSSNTKVATVSSKGKITAKAAGTATITISAAATSNYKAASKTIKITVSKGSATVPSTVYITKTGDKYHLGGCSYLSKSKIAISLAEAKKRGKTPCSKCIG